MQMRIAPMVTALVIWPLVVAAVPMPADPGHFKVTLFAEFSDTDTPGGAADDAFQMTITDGRHGFAPGMIVTGGPGSDPRIFGLDPAGTISVISDQFNGSETLVFATGSYGTGALVSVPNDSSVLRLMPDGSAASFAAVGTPPFGVAALAFGADGTLYASDFTGQAILAVADDGTVSPFSALPLPPPSATAVLQARHKAVAADFAGLFGGAFVAGTFSLDTEDTGIDALYSIAADGTVLDQIAGGLNGLELVTFGPGGAFGSALFLATAGTLGATGGAVYSLAADGTVAEFLTGLSAAHVTFDTTGLFGGDMFVSEISLDDDISRIWRVAAIPLPAGFLGLLSALALLIAPARRRSHQDR